MQASTNKVKAIVDMPPPNCKKQVQSFICMVNYLPKFSPHLSESCQREGPIQLGNWTSRIFQAGKERDCNCTYPSILQSQEGKCFTDRCQYQGTWSLLDTRRKTCIFCKQGTDRSAKGIHGNWARVFGSGLGNGEIPSFSICQPLHPWDRPETTGNNSI